MLKARGIELMRYKEFRIFIYCATVFLVTTALHPTDVMSLSNTHMLPSIGRHSVCQGSFFIYLSSEEHKIGFGIFTTIVWLIWNSLANRATVRHCGFLVVASGGVNTYSKICERDMSMKMMMKINIKMKMSMNVDTDTEMDVIMPSLFQPTLKQGSGANFVIVSSLNFPYGRTLHCKHTTQCGLVPESICMLKSGTVSWPSTTELDFCDWSAPSRCCSVQGRV
jgi:hypothetical protein